ncbi:MAG TPA: hypothetical protein V6C81_02595 [Planktothrix sp.]|jgi:hypothetical protein
MAPSSLTVEPKTAVSEKQRQHQYEQRSKNLRWWASFALLAFAMVAGCDMTCRFLITPDALHQPNRSWFWWSMRALKAVGPHPDIALCGSSLMVATVTDSDATFYNRPKDQVLERRCLFLEQLLQEKTGKRPRTVSFAIGGEMASDAYGITSVALQKQYKPKMIVWGVAPRDLIDRTFTNPNQSGISQGVSALAGNRDVFGRLSFWDKIERGCDKISFIYGHRQEIVAIQHALCKQLFAACGWTNLDTNQLPNELKGEVYKNFPDDEGVCNWVNVPTKQFHFTNNMKEYRTRYNPFNEGLYQEQVSFMQQTLSYCHDNGIKVLLVNMPITELNMSALAPGVYTRYLNDVKTAANRYSIEFVDLNDHKMFPQSDFVDTVHMNGFGAIKFWRQLVNDHWPS